MKYIRKNRFYVVHSDDDSKELIETLLTSLGFILDLRMGDFCTTYYDIYYQGKAVTPDDIIQIVDTMMIKLNGIAE